MKVVFCNMNIYLHNVRKSRIVQYYKIYMYLEPTRLAVTCTCLYNTCKPSTQFASHYR